MTSTVPHFVGGEWRVGTSTYGKINPSDTREVAVVAPDGGAEDALESLDMAAAVLPAWSARSILERAGYLIAVADLLASRSEAIAIDIATETGKTIADSRAELARAVAVFRFTAELARNPGASSYPSVSASTKISVTSRQLGIVALVSPWNLPLASAASKVAPALLAGNAAVLKVASESPHAAFHFASCFDDVGLPAGVLSVLTGEGGALGGVLITDDRVAAMSWTGTDVGVAGIVRDNCVANRKRLQLQLGGINTLVIAKDANMDVAVTAAVVGAFSNAGQLRTATRRILVDRGLLGEFRDLVRDRLEHMIVGSALDEDTKVGPVVNAVELAAIESMVTHRIWRGDRLLAGGSVLPGDNYLYAPTILEVDDAQSILADDEIFGPVVTIAPFDDVDVAIRQANTAERVVSASIATEDASLAERFEAAARAGQLHVNGPTIGAEPHVPYTGDRFATIGGPEGGASSLDFYRQTVASYHHYDRTSR